MGRMDTMTKEYLAHNEVFADAFNYLIYDGRPVIRPEALHELDTAEIALPYGTDQAVEPVQKYRDVLKELTVSLVGMEDEQAAYLILGIENQMKVHYAMPVRNMLYDALQYAGQVEKAGASYQAQRNDKEAENTVKLTAEEFLSRFRKTDRLVPVITLVIYFGADEWDGPTSIEEMFLVKNSALQPFIQNYKLNLITPKQIGDNEFEKFRSELGSVLLCAKHSKDENLDILTQPVYKDLGRRTADLINELTSLEMDFKNYINEKGRVDVCEAYLNTKREMTEQGIEIGTERGIEIGTERGIEIGTERGIEIGKEQGIEIGKESAFLSAIKNLMESLHLSIEQAMDVLKISDPDREKYSSLILMEK